MSLHRQPYSSLPARAASALASTCRSMAAPLPDNPGNITLSWFGSRDSTIRAPAERLEVLKNIEVTIANPRGPHTLSALAEELGRSVVPQSVQNTCDAET